MVNWKRVLEVAMKITIALCVAWWYSFLAKTFTARILVFAFALIFFAASVALRFFRGRRAVIFKIAFGLLSVALVLILRPLVTDYRTRADMIFVLIFGFNPFLPLRPAWLRRPWWPAMRRTIRRARGGWSEDEEQFVAEMSRPKK